MWDWIEGGSSVVERIALSVNTLKMVVETMQRDLDQRKGAEEREREEQTEDKALWDPYRTW